MALIGRKPKRSVSAPEMVQLFDQLVHAMCPSAWTGLQFSRSAMSLQIPFNGKLRVQNGQFKACQNYDNGPSAFRDLFCAGN